MAKQYPFMDECEECGMPFLCKGDWHTMCWSCFKETPAGQAWQRKKDAERGTRRESSYDQGQKVDPDNMDQQMCRLLIQLCHPDKHGGSAGANKATQWLNDRMAKLRK